MNTYADFSTFYNDPFIKIIAGIPKWTISTSKKMPVDMRTLGTGEIRGADFHNITHSGKDSPTMTLTGCMEKVSKIGEGLVISNHAFYLDALTDNFMILDVEPNCSQELKDYFLQTDYVYGEISLSGHGYHFVYPVPAYMQEYPEAMKKIVLRADTHEYEVHLNHWVTFTRNMIPLNEHPTKSMEPIFRQLMSQAKTQVVKEVNVTAKKPDIPNEDMYLRILLNRKFKKGPQDYLDKKGRPDASAFEFARASAFYHMVMNASESCSSLLGGPLDENQIAWIVYDALCEALPRRDKHQEIRSGMPWLMFVTQSAIAKSDTKKQDQ